MKSNVLVLTRGLPASGKSTYARKISEKPRNGQIYRRVSRDDIRRMLGNYDDFSADRERLVTHIEAEAVLFALRQGYNVIVDSTNLNPKHVKEWENLASSANCRVLIRDFHITLEEALERNETRWDRVDPQVILDMYNKWVK